MNEYGLGNDIATRQGAIRSLDRKLAGCRTIRPTDTRLRFSPATFLRQGADIVDDTASTDEDVGKWGVVYVIETKLGTGPRDRPSPLFRVVERCLRAIIPAADPDFEDSYGSVCKWWIEIDAGGVPQRELGFDEQGNVIAAAPMGSNFGFFTDSNAVFVVEDHSAVEASLFDAAWLSFESRWAQEHR